MQAQDILLDVNFDLLIEGGDFAVGSSDEQSAALMVITAPGHWKQYPFFGFNVALYKGSVGSTQIMKTNLTEQAQSDNCVIDSFEVQNGNIIDFTSHRTIV